MISLAFQMVRPGHVQPLIAGLDERKRVLTSMKSKLSPVLALCSLQRVMAGLVFIPLLAYSFAPFRDVALSFPQRLVFWSGVMVLAIAVTGMAGYLLRNRLKQYGLLTRDIAFAALILVLFAPSLWVLSGLVFWSGGQNVPGLAAVLPYGGLFATGLLLVRSREEPEVQPSLQRARLCRRLPHGFEGQIYRLTSRDHLVDVVTSEGVFTIRSRFGDAIAEMEPEAGHCSHRSHWVTTAAIVGVEKQGKKAHLRLRNGDLVPVSRKYAPGLEAAGLL